MNADKEKMYQMALMEIGRAFQQVCTLLDKKILAPWETKEVIKARAKANNAIEVIKQINSLHLNNTVTNTTKP